ncbi:MAG: PHP domain-containing protein [Verrucomicrobiota bacterium]
MIDLHTHSTFSDGTLTPEDLIEEAWGLGLTAIALTDHDTTAGIPRLLAAAEGKPLRVVPGVEISADFKPGTMHMLGYFIPSDDAALNRHLEWIREGRESRNREILEKLNKLGFALTWDEVKSFADEDVVGRPHFAKAMLGRGYAANWDEVFDKYLGKGKPAYAERRRVSPSESIRQILAAKGVPVLAHPFTLELPLRELKKLLQQLCDDGLQGVEVFFPQHNAAVQRQYGDLAKEFGLVATGGTDFHGGVAPDIQMGRGFGSLKVPDDIVDQLAARKPA